MNKIKAIEMYLSGMNYFEIMNATNIDAVELSNILMEYKCDNFITLESKINVYKKSTVARPVFFDNTLFESETMFSYYLKQKYKISVHRTRNRIRFGATPEQCLLTPKEYLER